MDYCCYGKLRLEYREQVPKCNANFSLFSNRSDHNLIDIQHLLRYRRGCAVLSYNSIPSCARLAAKCPLRTKLTAFICTRFLIVRRSSNSFEKKRTFHLKKKKSVFRLRSISAISVYSSSKTCTRHTRSFHFYLCLCIHADKSAATTSMKQICQQQQ